jgi:hypothetical protein
MLGSLDQGTQDLQALRLYDLFMSLDVLRKAGYQHSTAANDFDGVLELKERYNGRHEEGLLAHADLKSLYEYVCTLQSQQYCTSSSSTTFSFL